MPRLLLACLLTVLSILSHAQKEANIWYFGARAGIDFNTTPPTPLTDGAMTTLEGCASIADKTGALLFYTDGIKVWNKIHDLMPSGTGLKGNPSSTQSGVIVPQPGNDSIYYIISIDGWTGRREGCYYSEVNMNKDGGKGDVTVKNVPLKPSSYMESITAVQHSNGRDIWVIIKRDSSDEFYSYLVTPSGFTTTPVVSAVRPFTPNAGTTGSNYMKSSPNGEKVCIALSPEGTYLYDFNSTTGKLSNPLTIYTPASWGQVYGVEFSPNSKLLYLSGINGLYQYNLEAGSGDSADIIDSRYTLGTVASYRAVQLAPDGRIYIAEHTATYLDVIYYPDSIGLACGYITDDFYLDGKTSQLGLPTFIQTYFSPLNFDYVNDCLGDTTFFTLYGDLGAVDSVFWTFGDPASGPNNYSKLFHPWHIFTKTGNFDVCVVRYDSSGWIDTTCAIVNIATGPIAQLPEDTILCEGDLLELADTTTLVNFLWSDSSTDSSITVSGPGNYWMQLSNRCNVDRDTIVVDYHYNMDPFLGNDTALCWGDVLNFDVTDTAAIEYLWFDGKTVPTNSIDDSGTYYVTLSNVCGEFSDTINVTFDGPPNFVFGEPDTQVCWGDDLVLTASYPGSTVTYTWPDNSHGQLFVVNQPGMYWVTIENYCGTDTDSLYVDFDNCCAVGFPNAFTPNSDGINDEFYLIHNYCGVYEYELKIFNRAGQVVFQSNDVEDKWDGTWNGKDLDMGVYVYTLSYKLDGPTFDGGIPAEFPVFESGNVTLLR